MVGTEDSSDGLHKLWVWLDALGRDDVAQKRSLLPGKVAFLEIEFEVNLANTVSELRR